MKNGSRNVDRMYKKKELTLVNLVHTSEGDLGELLQRHHVDGRRHGLLAARLGTLA
jgi:hypothetical protein